MKAPDHPLPQAGTVMPIQPPEKTISDYKAAYEAANGKSINVIYARGWYRIGDPPYHRGYRESDMLEMIDRLRSRAAEAKDKSNA